MHDHDFFYSMRKARNVDSDVMLDSYASFTETCNAPVSFLPDGDQFRTRLGSIMTPAKFYDVLETGL